MGSSQSEEQSSAGAQSGGYGGADRKPKDARKVEPPATRNSGHDLATKMQGQVAVSGRYHREPKHFEEDYLVQEKVLGSGFNGSVFEATRKGATGKDAYAVKEFKLRGITSDKRKEMEQECEIFLSMDHPHIARLVDVYEEKDRMTLLMEKLHGGELFDRVIERKRFTEQEAAEAARQMLLAINYLHSHGIVHRDIKLENWLYETKEGNHLKLIDFGFSKAWDPNIKMHMSCGTLSYVAPEVLNKSYDSQCDMWSLGVVMFILVAGYMPFSGSDEKQVRCIKDGKITWKPEKWDNISRNGRDFVEKLLKVNPKERLTAEQALEHKWITQNAEQATSAGASAVNEDLVNNLVQFAGESKFRRSCMLAMAWSLSNEERAKLRDAFMAMDTNKTGVITLQEFKNCIEERFHLQDAEVTKIFKALDSANNNEIQYSEFLAAMVYSRINLYDDFLQTAFGRFDTDSSGYISAGNLKDVLGEKMSDKDLKQIMSEVDENHDGKISFQEFTDFVRGNNHSNSQVMLLDHFIGDGLSIEEPDATPSNRRNKEQVTSKRGSMSAKI